MSRQIPPSTPEINRRGAAAALIPIIATGLADSKLSDEGAALQAVFGEWAVEKPCDGSGVKKLAEMVGNVMERIRMALSSASGKLTNVIRDHSSRVRDDRSAFRR